MEEKGSRERSILGGDGNSYFHSSNLGATKGKQGKDGISVLRWKMEKGVTYG